jgi:hypothetical protein
VSSACREGSDAIDPSTLPETVRADYQVFARRCSKCHSLARPLTSGITDMGQWERYVARMRMQPGSGINAADEAIVLRFLKHYSAEELRKKAERNAPKPETPPVAPAASTPGTTPAPPPVAPPTTTPSPSGSVAP